MLKSGGRSVVINLEPHPSLNGAFWFAGLDAVPSPQKVDPDPVSLPDSFPTLSKVYVSEATNPFTFPATGIVTVGSGIVSALASATKALSQGQFGQFPLYAFSSEGVWALEVGASGAYAARQPVSRDVCTNTRAITQIDSAVLFPSDRGIMLLSGSRAECISDSVNSEFPFDLLSLPGFDSFRQLFALGDDSCLSMQPFSSFLADCAMLFDYSHQRILIFSPRQSCAYVCSLISRQWGFLRARIAHSLNSYPETLAVDPDNNLVSFSSDSSDSGEPVSGLLVSRPLKLGASDVLKTVSSVIQRGYFRKGSVRCALYGSRDLISWHLIRSSQSHFLRAFSGTPLQIFPHSPHLLPPQR